MSAVLGVDAGNTKTIALVARIDGTVLGTGRAGCGDIYGAKSPEAALAAVDTAVSAALERAGMAAGDLNAGVFCMAGADWPEDFELLHGAMEQRGYGTSVRIFNDAIGALRAGSADGNGVTVVCGTAAAIGARASGGRLWHTSFWQEPGASRDLGTKMLRAVYRADLGIDPPTALTARALEFFGVPSVEAVLHLLTARGAPRPNIDPLARLLLDAAAGGDATATRIVREHGASLGDYVLAAARQAGLDGSPFTLVLAGGVLRHPSPLLRLSIIERVRTTSPEVRPVMSRFEPAVGSLFLALEAAGVVVDEALIARILPTLPPPDLFATDTAP